jgi:hypothetical protein
MAGCGDAPQSPLDVSPSFDMEPDCGHIYDPCEIEGLVVVIRRQPLGPIEWPFPWPKPCTDLPGGCFPEDGDPIVGPKPYYGYGGPYWTIGQAAENHGWEDASPLSSKQRAEVQMEIRAISHFTPAVCAPLAAELSKRLGGGIWGGHNDYANGEWAREVGGGGLIFGYFRISQRGDGWRRPVVAGRV